MNAIRMMMTNSVRSVVLIPFTFTTGHKLWQKTPGGLLHKASAVIELLLALVALQDNCYLPGLVAEFGSPRTAQFLNWINYWSPHKGFGQ